MFRLPKNIHHVRIFLANPGGRNTGPITIS